MTNQYDLVVFNTLENRIEHRFYFNLNSFPLERLQTGSGSVNAKFSRVQLKVCKRRQLIYVLDKRLTDDQINTYILFVFGAGGEVISGGGGVGVKGEGGGGGGTAEDGGGGEGGGEGGRGGSRAAEGRGAGGGGGAKSAQIKKAKIFLVPDQLLRMEVFPSSSCFIYEFSPDLARKMEITLFKYENGVFSEKTIAPKTHLMGTIISVFEVDNTRCAFLANFNLGTPYLFILDYERSEFQAKIKLGSQNWLVTEMKLLHMKRKVIVLEGRRSLFEKNGFFIFDLGMLVSNTKIDNEGVIEIQGVFLEDFGRMEGADEHFGSCGKDEELKVASTGDSLEKRVVLVNEEERKIEIKENSEKNKSVFESKNGFNVDKEERKMVSNENFEKEGEPQVDDNNQKIVSNEISNLAVVNVDNSKEKDNERSEDRVSSGSWANIRVRHVFKKNGVFALFDSSKVMFGKMVRDKMITSILMDKKGLGERFGEHHINSILDFL